MRSSRQKRRSLAVLLTAGALALALTASAVAVSYVYSNGFSSRSSLKDLKKTGGGKGCKRNFRPRSKTMGIEVTGRRLCKYSPLVIGDGPRPDHAVAVKGRIVASQTPDSLKKAAYLAVQVRSGNGGFYELRVRPRGRRFQLLREPDSNAVAASGRDKAINPVKKANNLFLMVDGDRVVARVNGDRVAAVTDPNPGSLRGRRVAFGLGSRRDASRAIVAAFDRLRVGVP